MKWLRLDRHFYDKPQLEQIKNMEGGKDFIITYCLLLLAGGETIPCDKERLGATIGVPKEKIEEALNAFYRQKLIEVISKPEQNDSKPSFEEIEEYAESIGSRIDVRKFYDWYAADGFIYKGKPMDWKAKLRQWTVKERPKASSNPFLRLIKEEGFEFN